jgi:hypothetical protein
MRLHLPGVYSMDICDGRPIGDATLGALDDGRAPAADVPVLPVAVGVLLLLLFLLGRRSRGKPAAPATASAY